MALAVVVGLASRTEPFGSARPAPIGHYPTAVLETVALVAVVALLAGAVMTVWALAVSHRRGKPSPGRIPVLSSLGVIALAVLAYLLLDALHPHAQTARSHVAQAHRHGMPRLRAPAVGGHFEWTPLIVVAALVVVALAATGAWLWLRRRRRRPAPPPALEPSAVAVVVVEDSLADLRDEPDPRRAVVRAFLGMEAGLARAGFPRRPAEAPRELVSRALGALAIPEQDVRRLTGLFEVARYSTHPVGESMRDSAIEALEAVRAPLLAAGEGAAA